MWTFPPTWERNPVVGYSVNFQSLPVPYFERNFAKKPAFHRLSIYYLKASTVSSYKSATTGAQSIFGLRLILHDLQSEHMYRQVRSILQTSVNNSLMPCTFVHYSHFSYLLWVSWAFEIKFNWNIVRAKCWHTKKPTRGMKMGNITQIYTI